MQKMFLVKAQGVSRLPVTAETRVHSHSSLCEFCGERSGAGTGFALTLTSLLLRFHFFNYILFFRFLIFPSNPPIFCCFFFLFFQSSLSSFILFFILWPFIPSLFGLSSIFILFFRFLIFPSNPPIFCCFFFLFFQSSLSSFILFFVLWPFIPSIFGLSSIFILFFPSFSRLCNCQHFHTQVGSVTKHKCTQFKSYLPVVRHIPSAASAP